MKKYAIEIIYFIIVLIPTSLLWITRPTDLFGDRRAGRVILTQEYGLMLSDIKTREKLIKKYNLPWVDFHLSEGKFIKYYFKRDNGKIDSEYMNLPESQDLIDNFIQILKVHN